MHSMEVSFVVLIHMLIATVQAVPDLNRILCDGTEVCLLGSVQFNISCSCRPSSTYCFWTRFANRSDILTNGTTESLQLVWHSNTFGYGQFTCISRNSSSDNVERNVLIIPNVQGANCDGCINTTICTSTTGQCLLRFSKLFNVNSQCELYSNRTLYVDTFTEGMHVELHLNSSYHIQCFTPTCPNLHREIYYEIPTSEIKDCSNSDLCSQPSTITAAMFTTSISDSTATLSLLSFSLSSSFLPNNLLISSTDVTTVTPTKTDSSMTLSSFLMPSIFLPNTSLMSSTDITPTKTGSIMISSSFSVSSISQPNFSLTSSTDINTVKTDSNVALSSIPVSSSCLTHISLISSTDITTVTPTKSGGLIKNNGNNDLWTILGGVIGAIIFVILLVITVILLCYISQRNTNDGRAANLNLSIVMENVTPLQELQMANNNSPKSLDEIKRSDEYNTQLEDNKETNHEPACPEMPSDQNRNGELSSHSGRANFSKLVGDDNYYES